MTYVLSYDYCRDEEDLGACQNLVAEVTTGLNIDKWNSYGAVVQGISAKKDSHTYSRGPSKQGISRRCTACVSVEPVVVCSMLLFGLYSILSKEYIRQRLVQEHNLTLNDTVVPCNETGVNKTSPNYVLQQNISAETSSWVLYLTLSNFFPSLFSSVVLGSWCDKVGRKIPLLISLTGITLLTVCYLIVISLNLPLHFLFVGHVLSGLTADYGNTLTCSFSYLADISDTNKRTFKMGVLETCIGVGIFISSVSSPFWDLSKGFQNPFWFLFGVAVFEFLYALLFLPSTSETNFFANLGLLFSKEPFLHVYEILKPRPDQRHIVLVLFITCYCFSITTVAGVKGLLIIYEIGVPFCWNPLLVGIGSALGQTGYFVTLISIKLTPEPSAEPKLVMFSIVTTFISFIIFALSGRTWMLFLGMVFQFFFNIPSPVLRSQASKLVSPEEFGSVFALFSCALNIGNLLGSLAFEGLFALTANSSLPGAVFFMGNGFLMLFIPLYWIGYKKSPLNSVSQYSALVCSPNG